MLNICILVYGNVGLIGFTEDDKKFRRRQVRIPEVAGVTLEFQDVTMLKEKERTEFHRHEYSSSLQVKFDSHVKKLKVPFEHLRNPFLANESKKNILPGN